MWSLGCVVRLRLGTCVPVGRTNNISIQFFELATDNILVDLRATTQFSSAENALAQAMVICNLYRLPKGMQGGIFHKYYYSESDGDQVGAHMRSIKPRVRTLIHLPQQVDSFGWILRAILSHRCLNISGKGGHRKNVRSWSTF